MDKYKAFVKASINRAVRTIAQTAVALIGTSIAMSDVDWYLVISASILAGILSILTSIATNLPEVEYEAWQEMNYDDDIDVDEDSEDAEG